MLESKYQAQVIKELERRFPGCIVLKNDAEKLQGVPDLLILFWDMWAALEVKTSARAPIQPNQEYYVDLMNQMSFAAFIYPSNEAEVLDALQRTFETARSPFVSKP